MAIDGARRRMQESGRMSKQQRTHAPGKAQGSSHGRNKKDDPAVRRQRRLGEDGRLVRAREEQEAHEAELARLAAELEGQPHKPYVPATDDDVLPPEPVADDESEHISVGIDLLRQGYHIARVAQRTGIPVTALRQYVREDGYAKSLR